MTRARLVTLRGNHEDAWLRARASGYPEFVIPAGNGCNECMRSFVGHDRPAEIEGLGAWLEALITGSFFPAEVVHWMESLRFWYEDEQAIYVHGGLPQLGGRWLHPSEVERPSAMLWERDMAFFRDYAGKLVVCGHTATSCLPTALSSYTPDDPKDLWVGPHVVGLDTACGKGGFLTCLELPARAVYESR